MRRLQAHSQGKTVLTHQAGNPLRHQSARFRAIFTESLKKLCLQLTLKAKDKDLSAHVPHQVTRKKIQACFTIMGLSKRTARNKPPDQKSKALISLKISQGIRLRLAEAEGTAALKVSRRLSKRLGTQSANLSSNLSKHLVRHAT